MLKKEFKDAIKTFLFYCGFSIVLSVLTYLAIILTVDSRVSSLEIAEILIHPFMLLLAFTLGVSFFLREKFEGAFEYLLSLPLSRKQIIFRKIIPRLIILLAALTLYAVTIVPLTGFRHFVTFPSFACIYISVFLIGISLSLNRRKGVATVFQSVFFFIFSSALFFLFTYLVVYWQFFIKDQTAYFKKEGIFAKILQDEPLTILAAFAAFSLVLFIMFIFRFTHTDLKNQGRMPLTKYIRFIPLFALIFFLGFLLYEYQPRNTQAPVFRYEFAGGRLLQENGYDVFIHDRVGRHRIKLDISNQICNLLIQKTPQGDRCFLWDDLTLYRLDPQSYYPQTVYSMNSDDTKLFIKKSGNKVYLGEAGWRRTASRQFMYTSRLVMIDLDSGKHKVTDADFISSNPIFIYTVDSNQKQILTEIRDFKNGQIYSIDLRNGTIFKTDMHTKDAIALIKKKYPYLDDQKFVIFKPIGRTELLIKMEQKEKLDASIFKLDDKGVISPWQADLNYPKNFETTHNFVSQWYRKGYSSFEGVILNWNFNKKALEFQFSSLRREIDQRKTTNLYHFLRSEENNDIYVFEDEYWQNYFYKLQDNRKILIGELPDRFKIGSQYFESRRRGANNLEVFASGYGVVAKFPREDWDPEVAKKSFFRPFTPWVKDYFIKVFSFPDIKEVKFDKLRYFR